MLMAVLQVNVNQVIIRRIVEKLPLLEQLLVKRSVVVAHHLPHYGQVRALGLQDNQAPSASPPCPSAHLTHHHEGLLVGPEVGIIEHGVGVEYAHDTYFVEIQPLTDHLRADEQIGLAAREIVNNALIGVAGAGGIKVHAGHPGLGEELTDIILYLLRAVTTPLKLGTATIGAHRRHAIREAAVMTCQQIEPLIERSSVASNPELAHQVACHLEVIRTSIRLIQDVKILAAQADAPEAIAALCERGAAHQVGAGRAV